MTFNISERPGICFSTGHGGEIDIFPHLVLLDINYYKVDSVTRSVAYNVRLILTAFGFIVEESLNSIKKSATGMRKSRVQELSKENTIGGFSPWVSLRCFHIGEWVKMMPKRFSLVRH